MEVRDLLITPVFLLLIYLAAFLIRDRVSDHITRKYFIPALTVKILGALALGFIYQFYYGGGDTFTYFNMGSRQIWAAFQDSPLKAFQLIFADNQFHAEIYQYSSKIYTYPDPASYFVVRIAGLFDLITFSTYSATALLFGASSFSGMWAMFMAFYNYKPVIHKEFAISVLFVPSVFFWGSGLLKDTLTLGALGWLTWSLFNLVVFKKGFLKSSVMLLISFYVIYIVKIYILLCFVPAVIILLLLKNVQKVRQVALRILIIPVVLLIAVLFGYLAVMKVGEDNHRYSLEKISYTAESTARWISYVSEREGGSTYSLGDYDYSTAGMIRKFIPAVWVTLFRPYLWESHNPVMLLSSLESTFFLLITGYFWFKSGALIFLRMIFKDPVIIFCFIFAIGFSFAVGFSTYNFGSLVRYKIPMIPFYLAGILLMRYYAIKKDLFRPTSG